jgi:hypothetical protein
VVESVEDGGGEHVVATNLSRFNWNWLRLVQAESACGSGNEVFGVPPTIRADGGLLRGVHLDFLRVKKVARRIVLDGW